MVEQCGEVTFFGPAKTRTSKKKMKVMRMKRVGKFDYHDHSVNTS